MRIEDLPTSARDRLLSIDLQRCAAQDAAQSAAARIASLPNDADLKMVSRLRSEQDRHQQRHADLNRLFNSVKQWIMELRGVTLEPVPQDEVENARTGPLVPPGEAIGAVRDLIMGKRKLLAAARSAPLPKSEMYRLAADWVTQIARISKPALSFQKDELRVSFAAFDLQSPESILGLIAWSSPNTLLTLLEAQIDATMPKREGEALPAAARLRKVAALESELLALEHREEALISHATDIGLDVARRPDASPAAVLGVVAVKAQVPQQQVA
jgi:hypothetical protein